MKLVKLDEWLKSYPTQVAAAKVLGVSSQRLSGIVRTSVKTWYVLEAPDGLELLQRAHKNSDKNKAP